ncbi:MAG TPA: alpha/beta fold hydrolase [Gemmatimonadaceae bacterium]|jgi:pimeloyl-ACP methyl ester carboxylesterase|nr:alpha/beta fold hydrolase [Gemmatimonadaceae bacterium]
MPESERHSRGTLVLLHGLGRTARSMRRLAAEGARRDYRVRNLGYASRRAGIVAHAEQVGRTLSALPDDGPLYAVTHSMGGIILRAALAGGWVAPERIARVVMIAPPNRGSELADWLGRTPLLRLALGPAGPELRTGAEGIPDALPPLPCELGIIAGAASRRTLAASLFGGPNDGKVSVARASADGMRDLLVVPRGHTFIMNDPEVIAQTFHFLQHGKFDKPGK